MAVADLWARERAREPRHIVVVACGASKLDVAAPAKDLYTGRHFRLCRQYAERYGDTWCILSAKHLLLHPDQVVEPYNERMPTGTRQINQPGGKHYRAAMLLGLRLQASRHPGLLFEVLAGHDYLPVFTTWGHRMFLRGHAFRYPLAGMGIGHQDQWLLQQLRQSA
jgi:hypothetical protein